jgi:uncharacterized membrane protein
VTALTPVYWLIGFVFATAAWRAARSATNPKRATTATFWSLLALLFVAGDWLPHAVSGALVVALAVIAGFRGIAQSRRDPPDVERRAANTSRLGNRLFLPAALVPPVVAALFLALSQLERDGVPLLDKQALAIIPLALAALVALAVGCHMLRESPRVALRESHGLLDALGWALVLPLVLAVLGAVFNKSGVGDAVAQLVGMAIPTESAFACVVAYAVGMALFTIVMGNAFAAFPVMTAGVALPLLVGRHGAEVGSLVAIGMLSGYCGTLLTPMAANFNIVPAALLELRDQNGVIRMQVATALPLLALNVALMYFIVFR